MPGEKSAGGGRGGGGPGGGRGPGEGERGGLGDTSREAIEVSNTEVREWGRADSSVDAFPFPLSFRRSSDSRRARSSVTGG
jgi:hypothetical protein